MGVFLPFGRSKMSGISSNEIFSAVSAVSDVSTAVSHSVVSAASEAVAISHCETVTLSCKSTFAFPHEHKIIIDTNAAIIGLFFIIFNSFLN